MQWDPQNNAMEHVDLSLYHGCLQVTSVLKRRIATKHKLYNVKVLSVICRVSSFPAYSCSLTLDIFFNISNKQKLYGF